MRKEFVIRGQTATGETEVLNFSGHKPGYAYRLTEFLLYSSYGIGSNQDEMTGSITAGKTALDPTVPDFNNESLIGTSMLNVNTATQGFAISVVNDTFLITQNLILMVQSTNSATPVNWQCRFVAEKMNTSEAAVANYKQFTISDD